MTTSPIDGKPLLAPLPDCAAWTAFFLEAEIPVMRDTADALEVFRCHEDATDANSIGEMISGDPLMTLKVLAHEAGHRGLRVITPAETVTAAIVMMGVTPFFRAFGTQPCVEDRLMGNQQAWVGLTLRTSAGESWRRARVGLRHPSSRSTCRFDSRGSASARLRRNADVVPCTASRAESRKRVRGRHGTTFCRRATTNPQRRFDGAASKPGCRLAASESVGRCEAGSAGYRPSRSSNRVPCDATG